MRELKFRIWNGCCFVTIPDTYIKTSDGSLWDYEEDYGGTFSSHEKLWSADGKIQQYTGLKDKNGKEIYEGDILKYTFDGDSYPEEAIDKVFICEWDQENAWFVFREHDDDISDAYFWIVIRGYCEVIGNVFETPELSKQ